MHLNYSKNYLNKVSWNINSPNACVTTNILNNTARAPRRHIELQNRQYIVEWCRLGIVKSCWKLTTFKGYNFFLNVKVKGNYVKGRSINKEVKEPAIGLHDFFPSRTMQLQDLCISLFFFRWKENNRSLFFYYLPYFLKNIINKY